MTSEHRPPPVLTEHADLRPPLSESTALTAVEGPAFPVKLSKASVRLSRAHSRTRLPHPGGNRAPLREGSPGNTAGQQSRGAAAAPALAAPWALLACPVLCQASLVQTGHRTPLLPCPAAQSQVWPSPVAGVDVLFPRVTERRLTAGHPHSVLVSSPKCSTYTPHLKEVSYLPARQEPLGRPAHRPWSCQREP